MGAVTVLADPADAPQPGKRAGADEDPPRPLFTAGGMAAASAAAVGLATLTTLTLVGWIAAPGANIGDGLPDVFRTAAQGWLVAHHVGFAIPGGGVGMLPLGLVVLPGLLLYRSGRWLAGSCELPRLRSAGLAALAIAGPYGAIAGTLALISRTGSVQPSMFTGLLAGFLIAFVAGGVGVTHQIAIDKRIPWRRLVMLMPERPRSLVIGTVWSTLLLLGAGAVLYLAALIANFGEAQSLTASLDPGVVGGVLLLLVQLAYLPNAVIFGMSYAIGPGFAIGQSTVVAPTGVILGALPQFPMLAALPNSGPAPVLSLLSLAAPFVAGVFGGIKVIRISPTVVTEAAPMWGFACGLLSGAACAVLAAFAGGPLGAARLSEVGPSPWQVGLVAALEVGVAAAIAAWIANWLVFRRRRKAAPVEVWDAAEEFDDDGAQLYGVSYEMDEPDGEPAGAARDTGRSGVVFDEDSPASYLDDTGGRPAWQGDEEPERPGRARGAG
ncbi:DUF6350 family protein [Allonocardiopsis opalescens]|uniref:Integral membrane protein n=1 Tax=Allonocardiopsis opalescens TaxID=1144618 RepID=A0A2T0PSK5_9ACTN|nr:DUF6350 family protein [Allonocardiopsis opalescens]PRX91870.1 hypothetical protein CLV72_11355 [Allonocardiopsis opalescens]